MCVIWSLSPRDLILYRAARMRVGAERGCCGVWLLHCKGSYISCTWLCWVFAAPFDELTTGNTLFGIITKLQSMHATYGQCRHSVEELAMRDRVRKLAVQTPKPRPWNQNRTAASVATASAATARRGSAFAYLTARLSSHYQIRICELFALIKLINIDARLCNHWGTLSKSYDSIYLPNPSTILMPISCHWSVVLFIFWSNIMHSLPPNPSDC